VESGEGGGELLASGPGLADPDEQPALPAGDPGSDVQQSVAQRLRFDVGGVVVEECGLGPGNQVRGGRGELDPGGVDRVLP
jgi:hypothetical protein